MYDKYVTTEKDASEQEVMRRALAISHAHALSLSSFELANEADSLSFLARRSSRPIDISAIELQLADVRRRCADVRAGVETVLESVRADLETAEAVVHAATNVFAGAETAFNHVSLEVNFANN